MNRSCSSLKSLQDLKDLHPFWCKASTLTIVKVTLELGAPALDSHDWRNRFDAWVAIEIAERGVDAAKRSAKILLGAVEGAEDGCFQSFPKADTQGWDC